MDINLNNEWDITISPSGDIETITELNELAQHLSISLNEDIKKGLITIYPTNLSEFNGATLDDDVLLEIQDRIEGAVKAVVSDLEVEFKKPIITNDQKLFLPFKIKYDNEYLYSMMLYVTSDKIYVNFVN